MNLKSIWSEIIAYPLGVIEEMRKVEWPSLKSTAQLTAIAIVIIALATLFVGGLDVVLSRGVALVLGQA